MRTASCSSFAGITLRTGPKISSCAIVDELSTLPNTVGSTNQPRSRCFGRPPPAARGAPPSTPCWVEPSHAVRRRAPVDALLDVALDAVALTAHRERSHLGGLVELVTHLHLGEARGQRLDH